MVVVVVVVVVVVGLDLGWVWWWVECGWGRAMVKSKLVWPANAGNWWFCGQLAELTRIRLAGGRRLLEAREP